MQGVRALPATVDWRLAATALAWGALLLGIVYVVSVQPGGDARVWYTVDFPPNYGEASVGTFTFSYSPAFALLIQPFQVLPWPAFFGLVVTADALALAWLLGPWWAAVVVWAQVPFLFDSMAWGSLNVTMAALVVLGLTRAGPWVALALSKVTPGIGVVYHAMCGDWRLVARFAVASGVLLLVPGTVEWIGYLLAQGSGGLVRYAIGAGVIAWAAARGQPWAVPVAIGIVGHPAAGHWAALAAIPRLIAQQRPQHVRQVPAPVDERRVALRGGHGRPLGIRARAVLARGDKHGDQGVPLVGRDLHR